MFKKLLLLPALGTGFALILAWPVTAQTFTILHSFTATSSPASTNCDGANPVGGLILSNNTLYGTAYSGGSLGAGTVFAVNTDGKGFTNLHSFTGGTDGAGPNGLILSGNTIYGTAYGNANPGYGTVFALNVDGTSFTNLFSFDGSDDGGGPVGMVLSSDTLYGLTRFGGSSGNGKVFAVKTNGTGFMILHGFTAAFPGTNSDGAQPTDLILSGDTLFGTAYEGGGSGSGTVFALNTGGIGFETLHSFTATAGFPGTNSDGAGPNGMILSGDTLYGIASNGGTSGSGIIFTVKTNGTGFGNLYTFTAPDSATYTNIDGADPMGLILSNNVLYGTAFSGGTSGNGTLFSVKTDGTGFTTIYNFTRLDFATYTNLDGAYPNGLILSGNALYGTAQFGGSSGNGVVFSLSFRPQLAIIPAGPNVILMWPTNAAGFDYTGYILQSTTYLVTPVFWTANSPAPVVVNGQNIVTNPIAGTQQFYRLSK